MIRVALRGLAGRKLRASLTALAIVLGVAMISGTFILTDTIKKGFDTIFTESYKGADAVISGKVSFKGDTGATASPGFPDYVLGKVKELEDVDAASGSVESDATRLIDRHGNTIASGGAPSLGFSVDPKAPRFNPLTLVAGRWPAGAREIAIDKRTADKKHYAVGDSIGAAARGPTQQFRITGVAKFGSVASIGGASLAIFELRTAQKLFDKVGKLDKIDVAGKPDVSVSNLLSEIKPILPPTAVVKTADEQAKDDSKDTSGFISFLQKLLLAFAGIALFVGSFVIANTLSITIAQRVREFATLRTIGASRGQVLRSVILEALVIGLLASVVGLLLGFGLAKGLNALFVALGIDLPKSGTVFATRTIVVSIVVGALVTLLASLRPAFRATRVPAIAAVREGAILPKSRFARFGLPVGLAVLLIAIGLLVVGMFVSGIATAPRILAIVLGVLLLFFGVAINSHRLVRPLASVLGWPAARVGGIAGALARENATRNPSRTASTASALMIGITLITFVAVLGKGIRSTFEDAVDKLFVADYALTSAGFGFEPYTKEADAAAAKARGVTAVSGVRAGDGRIFGSTEQVTGVPPNVAKVIRIDWYRGNESVPARLGRDGAFVEKKYAKDHDLTLGSPLKLETPTGKFLYLKVKGVFKQPSGGSPFGAVTISNRTFDATYPQPKDLYSFINIRGGVTDENTKALENALKGFPGTKVHTQSDFKKSQEKFLNLVLNLFYVLLGLSIIVSLFGVVNTLVLSVFERTRELGMLRAVGMSRRQVRRMVRAEAAITAASFWKEQATARRG